MRTDVKIGIVVGLLVIGVVVIYFFFHEDKPATQPPAQQVAGNTESGNNRVEPRKPAAPPEAPATPPSSPGTPGEQVTPPPSERPNEVIPRFGEAVTPPPAAPATPPAVAVTPASGPAEVVTPAIPPIARVPDPSVRPTPRIEDVEPTVRPAIPPSPTPREVVTPPAIVTPAVPPASPAPAASTTERTYVVQQNDSGFWTVAEKNYGPGNGKYWTLIAKANPDVESSALRAGQKLKVPPLPAATPKPAGETPAGGASADQKTYVVKSGDSGFWGIAEKVYGNGSYWHLIANANPKVNSGALKVGQTLVLPPKPSATPATGPAAVGAGPATAELKPGQKIYEVLADDLSLWNIAIKLYNDGTKWKVLAKANPKVNPNSLRAGQKLVIPAPGEAAAPREGTTPPAREGTAPPAREGTARVATPSSRGTPSRPRPAPTPADGRPMFD